MHRAAIISFCLLFACTQHGVAVNRSAESAPLNESEQQRIESALRLQAFALDPFEKQIEERIIVENKSKYFMDLTERLKQKAKISVNEETLLDFAYPEAPAVTNS